MARNKLCGAKTKSGSSTCKNSAMKNGRCRLHGGLSTGAPKGNRNALKHGIYSRLYSNADLEEAIAMQGSINRELAITRMQLFRLLKLKQNVGDNPQINEIREQTLRAEEGEDHAKEATRRDAERAGEYYNPVEDDFTKVESAILERTAIYRAKDWTLEETRLISLIAKLELQAIKQAHSVIDLEDRKKEIEANAKAKGAAVDAGDMTDEQLTAELIKLLS